MTTTAHHDQVTQSGASPLVLLRDVLPASNGTQSQRGVGTWAKTGVHRGGRWTLPRGPISLMDCSFRPITKGSFTNPGKALKLQPQAGRCSSRLRKCDWQLDAHRIAQPRPCPLASTSLRRWPSTLLTVGTCSTVPPEGQLWCASGACAAHVRLVCHATRRRAGARRPPTYRPVAHAARTSRLSRVSLPFRRAW